MRLNEKQRSRAAGFLASLALLVVGATAIQRPVTAGTVILGIIVAGAFVVSALWLERNGGTHA